MRISKSGYSNIHYWQSHDLLALIAGCAPDAKQALHERVARLHEIYARMSEVYQRNKVDSDIPLK